jgi:hypothetical protein
MKTASRRIRVGLTGSRSRVFLFPGRPPTLLLALGLSLWSMQAHAQTASGNVPRSFPLQFVAKSASMSLVVEPGRAEVKFRKEPDFGKDRVFRHALSVGPEKADFLGFAVDLTAKTLYVDLNQNLDLTDDPQGIFKGEGSPGSYAAFKSVRIAFKKNGLDRSLVFEPFQYYSDDSGYLVLKSSCQAEIALSGQKWQLEVMDNLNGAIDDSDLFMIAPAAETGSPKGDRPAYSAMKIPKTLFLGGRLYRLKFTFAAQPGAAPLTVDFSEITAAMGELSLNGRFVARLVLEGKALAILDSPAQTVAVPSDTYKVQSMYLQSAPGNPLLVCNRVDSVKQLAVAAGAPAHLDAGGPVESSVNAASRGSMLTLSYLLRGVGGELYTAVNPDAKNPPTLTISQGGRQLNSGKFQFG